MKLSKGSALLMDMGTGKTKITIDTAEVMFKNGLIKNVLVICPLSITETWCQELSIHSSSSSYATMLGAKQQRIDALNSCNGKQFLNWKIINIDGVQVIKEELKGYPFDFIIVDESTTIKNRTAQRTKNVIELFQSIPYKVIMSGNPIPKSADEIFSQYLFLDPSVFGSSFTKFRDEFFNIDYFNKIISFKDEKTFNEKFHSIAFRKTKDECLDLPPKIYEREYIEMSDEQKRVYKEMEKDALAYYEDVHCSAPVVISKMLRLSQIAGGFFPSNDYSPRAIVPNNKLIRFVELIEGMPEQQIVVWARFNKEVEAIFNALTLLKIPAIIFYGKTTIKARNEALQQFRSGEIRVFIGSPAAGGRGINDLVGANVVIYYSNDYSAENRLQSEDRTHRKGTQGDKVLYIDLLMKDTIDVQVLQVLRNNKDFSDEILNRQIKW